MEFPEETRNQLKREIKAELHEDLKSHTVAASPARTGWQILIEHPAGLVVLGFLLTGVMGSFIGSCLQERQWNYQQSELARKNRITQKYALTDQAVGAIAESITAAEGVLELIESERNAQAPEIERRGRVDFWHQAGKNWGVASNTIYPKLITHFESSRPKDLFDTIRTSRDAFGSSIDALLATTHTETSPQEKSAATEIENVKEQVRRTKDYLQELTRVMIDEIHRDERSE